MGCAESREAEPGPEPEPIAPPTTDDNLARHLPRTSSYDQAMTAATIPGDGSPEDVEANLLHETKKPDEPVEQLDSESEVDGPELPLLDAIDGAAVTVPGGQQFALDEPAEQLDSESEADGPEPPLPDAIDGVAVTVPGGRQFAKVRKQLRKISSEVGRIAASWETLLANGGTLPAGEDLDTVRRAMLDAAGTLQTSVVELKNQVSQTEQKLEKANFIKSYQDERLAPIKALLAKREASLAATCATAVKLAPDGGAGAELTKLSAEEIKKLHVSSLHPDYVKAADPRTPTVQRVIGALVVALETGVSPAAETNAKLEAAIEVYFGKRAEAAADVVPKILDDVERYATAVADLMAAPGAAKAITELKRLAGLVDPKAEAEAADLVADSEAPAKTEPGHAFFLRRRAGSACAFLYSLVCGVVRGGGDGEALVIPGGIKAIPRMVFKTMVNYAGDFSRCKDVVRITIQVGSLRAVAKTVRRLFDAKALKIIRMKDRFQPGYDSAPTGGYRDVQLLCVFQIDGRWHYGEIQVNVDTLVAIKSRPDGGHTVFKFARSFEGYSEATYTFAGSLSAAVCEAVAAGLLINVNLESDKAAPGLRTQLWEALKSPKCRVANLK